MEEIKQLRSVVRDAMHFTVFFGRTHCKRRMCGLVVIFSSKVQEWCHSQAVTLKTASTNRSWVVEQLRGAFMQPLKGTMQLLTTEHVLEDLGFQTKFGAKDLHTSFAWDAKQCDDEYVASSTGGFVQALTKRRIFRSAWLLFGWPSRAALLLHESTRFQVLADLKAHHETMKSSRPWTRGIRGACRIVAHFDCPVFGAFEGQWLGRQTPCLGNNFTSRGWVQAEQGR